METFRNRATIVPSELPIALSEPFAIEKQVQWEGFLTRTRLSEVPRDFRKIIQDLQEFLWIPLEMAGNGISSVLKWKAGGPWAETAFED